MSSVIRPPCVSRRPLLMIQHINSAVEAGAKSSLTDCLFSLWFHSFTVVSPGCLFCFVCFFFCLHLLFAWPPTRRRAKTVKLPEEHEDGWLGFETCCTFWFSFFGFWIPTTYFLPRRCLSACPGPLWLWFKGRCEAFDASSDLIFNVTPLSRTVNWPW